MIPDKIYLGIKDLGDGWNYDLSLEDNGQPEFIRKDALMEWLDDSIEKRKNRGLFHFSLIYWGMRTAFGKVIDKLNSM